MPNKSTIARARKDQREGKSGSTQAGEFVREEFQNIRAGKHGARSTKQAIAIGLSQARRAGIKLSPPSGGRARQKAKSDNAYASHPHPTSRRRSRAVLGALQRESGQAASHASIARQTKAAARRRTPGQRSASARRAAHTRAAKR
jgi:Family of unknown function (DUF6496)